MSNTSSMSKKGKLLDLCRLYKFHIEPEAFSVFIAAMKHRINGNTPEEQHSALTAIFTCLSEISSVASDSSSFGSSEGVRSVSSGGRKITASDAAAAIQRVETVSGKNFFKITEAGTVGDGLKGKVTSGSGNSSSGAVPRSSRQKIQVVSLYDCPFIHMDDFRGTVTASRHVGRGREGTTPLSLNNGTTTTQFSQGEMDRMLVLKQRHLFAVARCHRSGIFRRGEAGINYNAMVGTDVNDVGGSDDDNDHNTSPGVRDSRTHHHRIKQQASNKVLLVPISSLEGLPEGLETAIVGTLVPSTSHSDFNSISSSTAMMVSPSHTQGTVEDPQQQAHTGLYWRLEDPRSSIQLIFSEGFLYDFFNSTISLEHHYQQKTASSNLPDENDAYGTVHGHRRMHDIIAKSGAAMGFFGKGSIVVVTGKWTPQGYLVRRMEMPPPEPQQRSKMHYPGIDFFGLVPHDYSRAKLDFQQSVGSAVVFLSHVHLDNPNVLSRLERFFREFKGETEEDFKDITFVLVGDLCSTGVSLSDISHFTGTVGNTSTASGSSTSSNLPIHQAAKALHTSTVSTSCAVVGRAGFQKLLDDFATTVYIASPLVAQYANFIIIPGPNDLTPLRGLTPQPPLSLSLITPDGSGGGTLLRRMPHTSLGPNPCRLRFLSQEIVVCRSDFYHNMFSESMQKSLLSSPAATLYRRENQFIQVNDGSDNITNTVVPEGAAHDQAIPIPNSPFLNDSLNTSSPSSSIPTTMAGPQPFDHVVKTIIDQAHLFPFVPTSTSSASNSAVFTSSTMSPQIAWRQDAALRIFPLPDLLVLCDRTASWECTYTGCKVINPGSFSATGAFVWYTPVDQECIHHEIE